MISSNINTEDVHTSTSFLKWGNHTIGVIHSNNTVNITQPNLNETVKIYTNGRTHWTSEEFSDFLKDRIVSPNRRDIERILFNCGLSEYNIFSIARHTRAINAKDLFWIANDENENYDEVINNVMQNMLKGQSSLMGSPVYSPDGVNVKCYGIDQGSFGVFKKRLHPMSTDVESEVAVYNLSRLMGIYCCVAKLSTYPLEEGDKRKKDERVAFSKFEYSFTHDSVIHARRFLTQKDREDNNGNEYLTLVNRFPEFETEIIKMIILDFVTRQTDRHWSNFAIRVDSQGKRSFYPLYDNGRSLFYEDSELFIKEAIKDVEMYSSEFGVVGTYADYIKDIENEGIDISSLVNLDITKQELYDIYSESGLYDYRLEGAIDWTYNALKYLKGTREII